MGTGDAWRVWSDLQRKEEDLKWGGNFGSHSQCYDSMGHPADASRTGWGYERMGRVERVRRALDDSGSTAQHMLARQLSGIDLSSIWSILMDACKDLALCYGGSVIAGAMIGGFGGAFLGGGGAVPGAAAGAAASSYAASAVLSWLGLKSLVEGVAHAVPEVLEYYEKGFREAWGPTKRDRLSHSCMTSRGDPASAAFYLAHGHVIMITTILAVLLAYVTKGKGGEVAALREISRSPRLGPKVAQWVEQNADKLRHHPKLRPIGGGIGHAEPPPPTPPRRSPEQAPANPRPYGMPKTAVPCFRTNGLPQGGVSEFDRQLSGQERGINDMTVDEYVKGRAAFDTKQSVRDPNMARKERAKFERDVRLRLMKEYQIAGMSLNEAKTEAVKMAAEKMSTLAALHNPDMVAGGKDAICDFGCRNVNSRIGAQWKKGGRLAALDKAVMAIPETVRANIKMNAKLARCK